MTSLYIGVDGGGTYCRARLVNSEGQALGEAISGSGNPRIGIDAAWQNIQSACLEACRLANIETSEFANIRLGLGLAGANQPVEQELILSQDSPFGATYLLTDAHAACLGAFDGEDGGLLILGTGSCGVVHQNKTFTIVGGWGFPLSDQGSGARIGLSALEHSLAALDGLSPTSDFTNAINEDFEFSPVQYVQFQNQSPLPKDYGAFAIKVFEYGKQQDPVALKIIDQQVAWVSQYLDTLIAKGAKQVALVGGVSEAIVGYLPGRFLNYLCQPKGDAMTGAIRMAQSQIGRSSI